MPKKVAVITWDAESVNVYADQITSFFKDEIEVARYNVQDGSASNIKKADLYVISTCAYDDYKDVNEYLPLGRDIVVTQVTIHKESLHRLLEVPRNTKALLVNINPKMSTETMAYLNKIGVNETFVNSITVLNIWPDWENRRLNLRTSRSGLGATKDAFSANSCKKC